MAKNVRKSGKKQSKASKKGLTKRKQTFMDTLPKNEIEHTELLIKLTERSITNSPDCIMRSQKVRLMEKLAELKKG